MITAPYVITRPGVLMRVRSPRKSAVIVMDDLKPGPRENEYMLYRAWLMYEVARAFSC